MVKLSVSVFFVVLLNISSVSASSDVSDIPEPFRGEDANSKYEIFYDDWTTLLKKSVLVTGRSTRRRTSNSQASAGTRFKIKKNVYTAMEGNRFFFEGFEDKKVLAVLSGIRKSLEELPATAPLKYFNAKEQIAYWLNLYNVALIEQLSQQNRNNMKKLLTGKKSILDKKLLTVSGVKLSLNDIHYNILAKKWGSKPLIIYGLYQGIIAGPNIRKKAFTGRAVFSQLRYNAEEFVNSNRGTMSKGNGVLNVSNYYERNKIFFPDFMPDIKSHLSLYIEGEMGYALDDAKEIVPTIKDWTVSSVAGNTRDFGKAVNRNASALATAHVWGMGENGAVMASDGPAALAALANKIKSHARFSADQLDMLMQLNAERKKRTGVVDMEEVKDEKDQ